MTHSMSRIRSAPCGATEVSGEGLAPLLATMDATADPYPTRYSMERRISVVMMRQAASGLMETSPVMSPTSPKRVEKSRNF